MSTATSTHDPGSGHLAGVIIPVEALNALFNLETYDEFWVLGDLVNYGPEPQAVVYTIRARAALVIRGNHDHAVGYDVDPRCSAPFRAMAEATRQLALRAFSDDDKHYLRELPLTSALERGGQRFFLCHATPRHPIRFSRIARQTRHRGARRHHLSTRT